MINLGGMDGRPSTSATAEKALSFLSKGWREVRNSADADIQLIRTRANKFKNIADRELENFLNSANPTFPVPSGAAAGGSIAEFEFMKKIQPKLSEIRKVYSSPEFLEKWSPRSSLSGIRNAIVAEVDEPRGYLMDFEKEKMKLVKARRRRIGRKGEKEEEEGWKEWEPIRDLKRKLKEFERKSQFDEIFGNFKSNELVEKVKLGLVI